MNTYTLLQIISHMPPLLWVPSSLPRGLRAHLGFWDCPVFSVHPIKAGPTATTQGLTTLPASGVVGSVIGTHWSSDPDS